MSAVSLVLCAVLAAVAPAEAPKAEIGRVHFVLPRVYLDRKPNSAPSALIRGAVRVAMGAFVRDSVHCPVMRMTCLCEQAGELVCYQGLFNRPDSCERLSTSEIGEAFRNAGIKLAGEDRKTATTDPARFTPLLREVTSRAYVPACIYGVPQDERKGFFRLNRLAGEARLLLTHLEMWQNGVLIGRFETSRAGLGRYDIPKDWYLPRKYPQKFRYAEGR